MNFWLALFIIGVLTVLGLSGAWVGWTALLGIVFPYTAIAIFLFGVVYRILKWASSPVPFHIPAVTGQQKSLPWIKSNGLESPSSVLGVIGRMAAEIFLFRSLFRNDKAELHGQKLVYKGNRWLWLSGLAFHWSLFVILFRHIRVLTEPAPGFVLFVRDIDSILQSLIPVLYITDILILVALIYLFLRRIVFPQIRFISLFSDYFALLLISGVVISGVLMRLVFKVDIAAVKELAVSVLTFQPHVPDGIGTAFYVHLFLASVLITYFPFSKMTHAAGIFLSPTRNLLNNSRTRRHVNPWDYPVKVHTYEEWENEYREAIKKAGLPLERG